jgi:tetratricopeptide (TPR) repeat protein
VLLRDDRPSEAQALFRTALELDPDYGCAHRELGFVLCKHGANPEAAVHLQKAIQLEPGDAWTHIYLGTCLWRCADVDAAIAEFRIAEELKPDWAVPLWSLGNIYECEYKDFVLAQSFFERALQLEPDCEEALKNLGRLFKKRGRFDLAREYLDRELLLDPGDKRVRALLSDLDSKGQV